MKMNQHSKFNKKCPNCKSTMFYKSNLTLKRAIQKNTVCYYCNNMGENNPMYGKKNKWGHHTEEHKEYMRNRMGGENHPNFGISNYDRWVKKYGKDIANKKQMNASIKQGNKIRGRSRPDLVGENSPMRNLDVIKKHKESMRNWILNRIENRKGQVMPNYNPEACKIIDEYGKGNGYDFQHAENGGEVRIGGYFPDGLDEKRKTIIEVDENYHFTEDGKLREKDIERQTYLENLGYDVIRINFDKGRVYRIN